MVAQRTLLKAVKAFREASLRGDYYEGFNVNSKNFMKTSCGTTTWITECNRLLNRCAAAARKERHAQAREGFDTLFDLLRHIDKGYDDVVFFADEGGSWQVCVIWDEIMPAYFKCLAATSEPGDYAGAVTAIIDYFVRYDRDKYLRKARSVANPAQRNALR